MEKICEELDEAKAEIDKLRAEIRSKGEISQSLKRAHDKLVRIQELNSELEKQLQQSNEKDYELSEMKQKLEGFERDLHEKQGIVMRLSAANDKLRNTHTEEICRCEEEKRELVFKLEEENAKNVENEEKIRGLEEAIKGLKGVLSVSGKKRAQVEELSKASSSTEVRYRDDILPKLEDENREIEGQLKRKREQFEHLKEAHERLRDQLRVKTKEWEKEKTTLLDEIDTLHINLESQTRISKDLQSRVQMCNQALAHEETKRKSLEIQLLESKSLFENVASECEEAKSRLECLSDQRDKDIATLRDTLGTKDTFYKEMEYKVRRLEQDNQELKLGLKEFQEAQIKEAGSASSTSKLRNKLKGLEQIHADCSAKFKVKEAEWISEKKKIMKDLSCCRSEQETKDELLKELNLELEGCQSLIMQLTMQIEESSVMLLVLQSEIKEAQSKLVDEKVDVESENCLSFLKQQLEMKDIAIIAALKEVEEERGKVESLSKRMESLTLMEEEQVTLKKDLDNNKKLVVDSFACQEHLKEQVLQLKGDLNRVYDALDKADEELSQKFCEVKESEYELQLWESLAERLKANAEQNYQLRKQVEASLLEQVSFEVTLEEEKEVMTHLLEEKDKKINHLLQTTEKELKLREALVQSLEEKDQKIDDLQLKIVSFDQKLEKSEREIEWWEAECLSKELETAILAEHDTRRTDEELKLREALVQSFEEKDRKIDDLQLKLVSLNQKLEKSEREIEWWEAECLSKELETAILAEHDTRRTDEELKLREALVQSFEEKDRKIDDLQLKLVSLNQKLEKSEREIEWWEAECLSKELETAILAEHDTRRTDEELKLREALVQSFEEKDRKIDDLQLKLVSLNQKLEKSEREIEWWEAECLSKELETAILAEHDTRRTDEELKLREALVQSFEEKDRKIDDLQLKLVSLNQKLEKSEREIEWWEAECLSKELETAILAEHDTRRTDEELKLREALVQSFEEKDRKIDDLQLKLVSLNQKLEKSEREIEWWEAECLSKELETAILAEHDTRRTDEELKLREALVQSFKEKDRKIDDFQLKLVALTQKLEKSEREIEWWEAEWLSKELETAILAEYDARRIYEHENKKLHLLVDEKAQKIVKFQQHVSSMEQEFENSVSSFSSQLVKLQAETNLVHEAREKSTTTAVLKEFEIEYKNLMIAELQNDLSNLQQKLELQDKFLSTSVQKRQIQVELELFDRFSKLYNEDMQLMGSLGKIVQKIDENVMGRELKDEEFFDPVKENVTFLPSPMTKKIDKTALMIPLSPSTDGRSPLRTLNS